MTFIFQTINFNFYLSDDSSFRSSVTFRKSRNICITFWKLFSNFFCLDWLSLIIILLNLPVLGLNKKFLKLDASNVLIISISWHENYEGFKSLWNVISKHYHLSISKIVATNQYLFGQRTWGPYWKKFKFLRFKIS